MAAIFLLCLSVFLPGMAGRRTQVVLAVAASLLAVTSYFNFSWNQVLNVHYWDSAHYYLGAKYFPEIGYQKLYACTTQADSEDVRWARYASSRNVRDLRNNKITKGDLLLSEIDCRGHFSLDRWEEFKRDVEFFRSRLKFRQWQMLHMDHGFNAPPWWGVAGHLLTNATTASEISVLLLAKIDLLLIVVAFLAVFLAFGLQVTAVAIVTTFCSGVYDAGWINGSLLRWDWFLALVLGIAALRKGWWGIGGAALAVACLLRIFPAVVLVGLLAAGVAAWRRKDLDTLDGLKRVVVGGLLAGVLLTSASVAMFGPKSFVDLRERLGLQDSVVMFNQVGIRTALTTQVDRPLAATFDRSRLNPFDRWSEEKLDSRRAAAYAYPLVAIPVLILVATVSIFAPLWAAAAASLLFLPFMWQELLNYYYVVMAIPATLVAWRAKALWPLVAMCAASLAVAGWVTSHPDMMAYVDVQYALLSVVVCLSCLAAASVLFIHRRGTDCSESPWRLAGWRPSRSSGRAPVARWPRAASDCPDTTDPP